MYHVRDDFRPGTKTFGIPLSWYRAVARFINSLCPGTGIKMTNPAEPSAETPVSISIDEGWLASAVKRLVPSAATGGGVQYSAGEGIDAEELELGKIAVDPDQVVTVLAAEGPVITIDGNTASGTDETLDQTTWEAGGTSKLVKAEFTRAKAVTVNNVYYYRLFWRLCTYNPNGTRAAVSAEQGYVQVRRL